jgi:hypothetical protein
LVSTIFGRRPTTCRRPSTRCAPKGGDIRRVEGAIGATSGLTIRDREADLCIWLGERGAGLPGLL